MRRLRNYNTQTQNLKAAKTQDAATSPIGSPIQNQVAVASVHSILNSTMLTKSPNRLATGRSTAVASVGKIPSKSASGRKATATSVDMATSPMQPNVNSTCDQNRTNQSGNADAVRSNASAEKVKRPSIDFSPSSVRENQNSLTKNKVNRCIKFNIIQTR